MLVLPSNPRILVQVIDAGPTTLGGIVLQEHPTHVRVPEAPQGVVGVLVGVGVPVVSPVIARPPA